jgi:hypothetical protein
MKSQIRHLIAEALWPTNAFSLPAVCERYGLEPGEGDEAFSSKRRYVLRRLEKLSDEKVLQVAKSVLADVANDPLQSAGSWLRGAGHRQAVSAARFSAVRGETALPCPPTSSIHEFKNSVARPKHDLERGPAP